VVNVLSDPNKISAFYEIGSELKEKIEMRCRFQLGGAMVALAIFTTSGTRCLAQTSGSTGQTNRVESVSAGSSPALPVVLVPIHMSKQRMEELSTIMHSKRNSCFLEDLDPGDDSSLIMICGVEQDVASFAP
jgi:hypothetical protein